MSEIRLPALRGDLALGFLAALGALRVLAEDRGYDSQVRLSWSLREDGSGPVAAVLHGPWTDVEQVVEDLVQVVDSVPPAGVLPGVQADFPPIRRVKTGGDPAVPATAAAWHEMARALAGTPAERWLYCTSIAIPPDVVRRTPFMAPRGQQSVRSFFAGPLDAVRRDPPLLLREALMSWRPVPGVADQQLDIQAYDSDGASRGAVPGATWLAAMALPLLPLSYDHDHRLHAALWHHRDPSPGRDRGRDNLSVMSWPLWRPPVDLHAVRAILTHPALIPDKYGRVPDSAHQLGVFAFGMASRANMVTWKSAGPLAIQIPAAHPVSRSKPTWDMGDVGALFGVDAGTVSKWRERYATTHPIPEPDGYVGRSPYWLPEREQEWRDWEASRPGRGAGGGRPRLRRP